MRPLTVVIIMTACVLHPLTLSASAVYSTGLSFQVQGCGTTAQALYAAPFTVSAGPCQRQGYQSTGSLAVGSIAPFEIGAASQMLGPFGNESDSIAFSETLQFSDPNGPQAALLSFGWALQGTYDLIDGSIANLPTATSIDGYLSAQNTTLLSFQDDQLIGSGTISTGGTSNILDINTSNSITLTLFLADAIEGDGGGSGSSDFLNAGGFWITQFDVTTLSGGIIPGLQVIEAGGNSIPPQGALPDNPAAPEPATFELTIGAALVGVAFALRRGRKAESSPGE